MHTTNNTNPGQPPVQGDQLTDHLDNGGTVVRWYQAPIVLTVEEDARERREGELRRTDFIVPITDHPQHAAYLTYRQALRDWPNDPSFPDTIPEAP